MSPRIPKRKPQMSPELKKLIGMAKKGYKTYQKYKFLIPPIGTSKKKKSTLKSRTAERQRRIDEATK